jgi:hypothetical protein
MRPLSWLKGRQAAKNGITAGTDPQVLQVNSWIKPERDIQNRIQR